MKARTAFDDVLDFLLPAELDTDSEDDDADDQSPALLDHIKDILDRLRDMEQAIVDRYKSKALRGFRNEQLEIFNTSLVRVAKHFLEKDDPVFTYAAIDIASFLLSSGGKDEDCLKIFNAFDEQVRGFLSASRMLENTSTDDEEEGETEDFVTENVIILKDTTRMLFDAAAIAACESPVAAALHNLCVDYSMELLKKSIQGYKDLVEDYVEICATKETFPGAVAILEKSYDMADLNAGLAIKTLLKEDKQDDAWNAAMAMVSLASSIIVNYDEFPSLAARAEQSLSRYYGIMETVNPELSKNYLQGVRAECEEKASDENLKNIQAGFRKMARIAAHPPAYPELMARPRLPRPASLAHLN